MPGAAGGLKLKGAAGDAIPDGSISKPHLLSLGLLTSKKAIG
ncbi:MAG: hypothetical protein K1060chlam2_00145 [Chlamydiae bacterium]|nr:hypothetical protein [Chlamydiota bacterium]